MQPKFNKEGETAMQEKADPKESKRKEGAEVKAYSASQKKGAPSHKPGTKKYCPTCNRSVSCPHM